MEHLNFEPKMVEDFGDFLHQTRIKYGFSLNDLSIRTGLSPSYIYRIEKHLRRPSVQTMIKIIRKGFGSSDQFLETFVKHIIFN